MAYATVAEAKLHLGIPAAQVGKDAALGPALDAATSLFDKFTKTFFDQRDAKVVTTHAPRPGLPNLYLPANVRAVTSVVEDGTTLTEGNDKDFVVFKSEAYKPGRMAFESGHEPEP